MKNGKLRGIYIAPRARGPMKALKKVKAIAGRGLQGDRYCKGKGSYNCKTGVGNRQVTLINARFITGSGFKRSETRRNLVVEGVELMWLVGKEFWIGNVKFRGIKYCEPCEVPKNLARKRKSFAQAFFDCGGLIAEVLEGGIIKLGDVVIPPAKNY